MFTLLINLLLVAAVFGFIVYIINLIPFPPGMEFLKQIIFAFLALAAFFYILSLFGIVEGPVALRRIQ